jgi:hypothetical protein
LKPRFSLLVLLSTIGVICVGLAVYRYLYPPPVEPIPADAGGGTYYSYAFGYQYEVEITEGTFARTPKWDRRSPNPPLSANEAMVRAERTRKRLIKEKKLQDNIERGWWTMDSAELKAFDQENGQWYWMILFDYRMAQTGPPNELRIVVLMDGTVIEPTVTKE